MQRRQPSTAWDAAYEAERDATIVWRTRWAVWLCVFCLTLACIDVALVRPEAEALRLQFLAAFLALSVSIGLATLLPTVLTLFILVFCYNFLDQKIARPITGALEGALETETAQEYYWRGIWNLQVEPAAYLRRLAAFCEGHGLDRDAGWFARATAALEG